MSLTQLQSDFFKLKNPAKAEIFQRFFKTGPGEYGEGDVFLGLTVPQQRQLVKKHKDLDFLALQKLLQNKIHEYRLVALLILVEQFGKADENKQRQVFNFYLKNTSHINNWDLVDLSAPKIIGAYLLSKKPERKTLYQLAKSSNLWEKRIAILATYTFIKNGELEDTLKISEILLKDKHDLIHKAVGWMLRELGKIDQNLEEQFLQKYGKQIPRTMLRYAIEKFEESKRQYYLKL
ncbi:DNA alkylation repair protein [Candidatus Beckwithbacteria bacterium]|nr:DNA alkylation repair protein [Candidatus Beckwithbacteria bacterium]